MLQHTEAIVLHAIKYSDNSIIVNTYTKQFGRLAFMVHGVNSKKAKFPKSIFQPLNIIEIEIRKKQNREIHFLEDVKIKHPNHQIYANVIKSTIALFIGEVLYKTLREEEPNIALFDYLSSAIQVLEINDKNISNFHLIFLLQFTSFLGIHPRNHSELDLYQPENSSVLLIDLIDISLNDLARLQIDPKSRILLIDSVIKYYADHLEGLSKINSLQVLHSVFS